MTDNKANPVTYSPRSELIMPEYGRNIQKMVEVCIKIEDREQRNKCAKTIIVAMGKLFPYLRDIEGFNHKLWDHLAIMSEFKLDIDYPFEIIKKENVSIKPAKIPYSSRFAKYMHYGTNIERFIKEVCNMTDEEQKKEALLLIGNFMKKSLIAWNKEIATDAKVAEDIKSLSNNMLEIDENIRFTMTADVRKPKVQQYRGSQTTINRNRKKRNGNFKR